MAFDGDNGLGIVNGPKVMEQVIKMAKENGIATTCFLPWEEYQNRMDDYIEMIKNARRAPGVTRIWLPGEIEFEKSRTIEKEGVEIPPATEARLLTTCRSLGMISEDGTLTQLIMGN